MNLPPEQFKHFLVTAPITWGQDEAIRRFQLPSGESVSCVLWNQLYHISGTDIVRSLGYRLECLGRKIVLQKKFEEGIFSDLRNLKPQADASLEESRSPFLKFLYENQCIRTQKRQKVFYWFSVLHDKLFMDALERDLKREAAGLAPTTVSSIPMTPSQVMEQAKAHCIEAVKVRLPQSGTIFDSPKFQSNRMIQANTLSAFSVHPRVSPAQAVESTHSLESQARNDLVAQPPFQLSQTYLDRSASYTVNIPSIKNEFKKSTFTNDSERDSPYPTSLKDASNRRLDCTFEDCEKTFDRQDHLKRHTLLHTGEKPYLCTFSGCQKAYLRSDRLKKHMKTHTHNSPWKHEVKSEEGWAEVEPYTGHLDWTTAQPYDTYYQPDQALFPPIGFQPRNDHDDNLSFMILANASAHTLNDASFFNNEYTQPPYLYSNPPLE